MNSASASSSTTTTGNYSAMRCAIWDYADSIAKNQEPLGWVDGLGCK